MFRKLHQQNTKPRLPASPTPTAKSPSVRSTSYSKIQNKKQNNSDVFDYQLCLMKNNLYQGCFLKNKKHGEGVMLTNLGVTVLGNWNNGHLNGYALFVTPFGGKVHAHYQQGMLEGWAILQYGNNFEIVQYKRDIIDTIRLRYDQSQQLWTQALYSKIGKLQKVLKVQKTKDFKLPVWIRDPIIIKLYEQLIVQGKSYIRSSKIAIKQIDQNYQYLGFTDNYWNPHGLGVICSRNELYAGNFKNGALDEQGLILFQNGIIYKGQIIGGKIWGNGAIYDVNMDQTKYIFVDQQGIEKILQQKQGYKLGELKWKIGKIQSKINTERGFSITIDLLCQQIVKYYYRAHSMQIQGNMTISQDEMQIDVIPITKYKQPIIKIHQQILQPIKEKQKKIDSNLLAPITIQNQNLRKLSQFMRQAAPSQNKEIKKQNFSKSLSKNNKLQKPAISSINEFLNDSPSTIVKDPLLKSPTSFISSPFTFDEFKKTNKAKAIYPYLMQFQLNKKIMIPGSNVGKIVTNLPILVRNGQFQ